MGKRKEATELEVCQWRDRWNCARRLFCRDVPQQMGEEVEHGRVLAATRVRCYL